jgi:hypothetical protein
MEIQKKMDDTPKNHSMPMTIRTITQNGEKSVYIENNTGGVTIELS